MTPSPTNNTFSKVQDGINTANTVLQLAPATLSLIALLKNLFGHAPSSSVTSNVVSAALSTVHPEVAATINGIVSTVAVAEDMKVTK